MQQTQSSALALPFPPPFLGLAPFLRRSIAGEDLRPLAEELHAALQQKDDDPDLWMSFSLAVLCLQQREMGLLLQQQALERSRIYCIPAQSEEPLRLLLLVVPGDLSANTPLDCLLENSNIEIIHYYVSMHGNPLDLPVPEHDLLMVGISEADEHRDVLRALEGALAAWPRAVINLPQQIPNVGREIVGSHFRDDLGMHVPETQRCGRELLMLLAEEGSRGQSQLSPEHWPMIIRPVGSHGGRGLDLLADESALTDYLAQTQAEEYFVSPFVDYAADDGLYRKYRLVMIAGRPYPCHMAISSHWMVHYVNAGMYEDAAKRAEESAFFANFAAFAARHRQALESLHLKTGLDYFGIDCAETRDGRLLVFEIDHAMIIHAMDSVALFPGKQTVMHRVREALCDLLQQRCNRHPLLSANA